MDEGADVRRLVGHQRDGSFRGLLAGRDFRLFFAASFGSSLGDWAGLFALQILVTSLSAGTRLALFALGGVMMARLLPSLVVGPVAGVLADRYDRKRLMVVADVVRGALFVGVAFSDDLLALLALTFIVECLSLAFAAAKDASLPALVDRAHLGEANQLNLLATYGTLPLGGILTAAATGLTALLSTAGFGVTGVRVALLVNAASFLISAALLSRVRLPRQRGRVVGGSSPGMLAELRAGLEFINGRPMIKALILGVVGVFFGAGVVVTLGPEFVRTDLRRPETDWSLVVTCVGLGVIGGILLYRRAERQVSKARMFPWALAGTGGTAALVALAPSFTLVLPLAFLLGASAGLAIVTGYTLLHETTPDEVRSRTFATLYTGSRVALFASLAFAPFLAGAIETVTLIVGGEAYAASGTRIALGAGGLFGLGAAVLSGSGMYRGSRFGDRDRTVRIPVVAGKPAARRGVFIAVEGGEGAGKSMQVRLLVAALEAEGHDVVVTREPGGPPTAERIRQILLDPHAEAMHPRTEALLYAAARAEHVQRVILPALAAGKVVVCDRFLDSSLAYQGYGRELGVADVADINRWAIDEVVPQATVLLVVDPEEGLRRVAERARREAVQPRADGVTAILPSGPDRIEREDLAFHRRVAEGYLDLAAQDAGRFVVIDATGEPEAVARQVRSGLHGVLPLRTAVAAAAGTAWLPPTAATPRRRVR